MKRPGNRRITPAGASGSGQPRLGLLLPADQGRPGRREATRAAAALRAAAGDPGGRPRLRGRLRRLPGRGRRQGDFGSALPRQGVGPADHRARRVRGWRLAVRRAADPDRPHPEPGQEVTVQARKAEGTLEPRKRTLYSTEYGPVFTSLLGLPLFPWTPASAYALGDANAGNFRLLNHFLEVNRASRPRSWTRSSAAIRASRGSTRSPPTRAALPTTRTSARCRT